MKYALIVTTLTLLIPLAMAKDAPIRPGACLAVYPALPYSGCVGPIWKDHFKYLESAKLSMGQIKVCYNKKELEKLEAKGVKIVVTTEEAVRSRSKAAASGDSEPGHSEGRAESVGITDLSAGCR
jgi:hypothetical protein